MSKLRLSLPTLLVISFVLFVVLFFVSFKIPPYQQALPSTKTIRTCQDIRSNGTYVLTNNIYGVQSGKDYCIGIFADNVVLDGNGYGVEGPGGYGIVYGIKVISANNVTIKTLEISNYSYGIYLDYSINSIISDNTIKSPGFHGIYLRYSYNITIKGNTILLNNYFGGGICLDHSYNNTIVSNVILSLSSELGGSGIYMTRSLHNIIFNNFISSFIGISLRNSSNNMIVNNYFRNLANVILEGAGRNYWSIIKIVSKNIVGGNYLGGNYWSSPLETGFSDTCEDSDGDEICDSPFRIDENNIDWLPLTKHKSKGGV